MRRATSPTTSCTTLAVRGAVPRASARARGRSAPSDTDRGDDADDDRRVLRASGTGRRTWSSPPPGPRPRRRVVAALARRFGRRRGAPPVRSLRPAAAEQRVRRVRRRRPSRRTWPSAGAPCRHDDPIATRWRRQPGARRRHVEPPVPGDPRGARARVLRVLRAPSYADTGSLASTPAPARARLDEVARRSIDARARRRVRRRASPTSELDVAKGYLEGSMLLGLEDSGEPHGPPRPRSSCCATRAADRRARGRSERSRSTTSRRVAAPVLGRRCRAVATVGPVER